MRDCSTRTPDTKQAPSSRALSADGSAAQQLDSRPLPPDWAAKKVQGPAPRRGPPHLTHSGLLMEGAGGEGPCGDVAESVTMAALS